MVQLPFRFLAAFILYFLLTPISSGAVAIEKDVLAVGEASSMPATLKVGIYNNYPFVYEQDGLPTGFHIELLKEISKKEGWKLEYVFLGSLKNVLSAFKAASIDLAAGLVISPEESSYINFSKELTAAQTNQVFVHSKRKDIRKIDDLAGKTVGYIYQDSIGGSFKDVCSKLGVEPTTRHINSYEQLSAAVLTNVVDAGIFSAFQGEKFAQIYNLKATPITFKKSEVYYGAPKGTNKKYLAIIDKHISEWKSLQNSPFYRLETTFLTNSLLEKTRWTKREILITFCLCLLLIIFATMLGNFMARETSQKTISKTSVRNLLLFTFGVTITFWILDSFTEWLFFNADQGLGLLELAITDIPPENLYIRGMFFGISCFFALFIAKYMSRYEEALNLLMVSVERFERLTDNAPDMIYRMALPTGRYEFVSKASEDICGYSPEDFYKRPRLMDQLIHPDWEDYWNKQWHKLLAGEMAPVYEYQIITKSGEPRWINQRNTLYINSSGEPTAIEAIVTDVTNFSNIRTVENQE